MHKVFAAATLAALSLPATAFADETANGGWKGQGELGFAAAKGNTDSQTLVGKLNASNESGDWKNSFGASFLYAKSADADSGEKEETARRYEIFGSSGYHFTGRSYVFGSARHERDHFTPYEYQWTAAFGYGFEAIKNDKTHLTFEVGPGYRWAKVQDERTFNDEAIVRGWMDFGHQLTDTTSVYNTLLIETGSDNTFAKNDLGLQVQMNKTLALKAGFEVRHNTNVLPDTKKTDTLTTVNVVYGF